MTNVSTCTVIVPTYDRATLTGYTLGALTRQSLPRDKFEVIVVDDGSTDNTAEVVSGYRTQLNLRYFYQPDEGYRAAAARNVAIGHAQGDVCVFVDSGVLASTGCLAAHVASHDAPDGPVAVCGYMYGYQVMFDISEPMSKVLDVTDIDKSIERMKSNVWLQDVREHFFARYTEQIHELPAPWQMYWTGNASAVTSLVREVGGFDDAFRCWGGEDIDLGYRLYCAQARLVINRAASSVHHPHPRVIKDDAAGARKNYRHMLRKYGTREIRLLAEMPETSFIDLNDILLGRMPVPDLDVAADEDAGIAGTPDTQPRAEPDMEAVSAD